MSYAAAAALTAVGLGVAFLFQGLRGLPDGLVFAATVALSARYFGLGPSLFATALSILAIDYMMLPPLGKLDFSHPEELAYTIVFVVLALVISGMTHSLRIARAAAESNVMELERVNERLAHQIDETQVISEHLADANEELTIARDAAEALAARANRLRDVTTALAAAQLPDDVARVVVGRGFDVLEAIAGEVEMIDGSTIRVLARRGDPEAGRQSGAGGEDPSLAEALRVRAVVWLESPQQLRDRFPRAAARLAGEHSARAFVIVPLTDGDALIGGLIVGFRESSALGAADHTFVALLAQSVGSALARARTFERERNDRRYAEALLQAREEVLGVVAHDLRNPLGVAGAAIQLLGDQSLEGSERDRLIGAGTRAVDQMNRLIGDLLDVVRLEAGRLALDVEPLSAAAVLAQAAESVRLPAVERGITLVVEPADESLQVQADRGRLAQVFGNLLGNALKFTPRGGRVSLRASAGHAEVIFEIADTGPGIPPESAAHLFDRFWQANRTDRRGVGLGLPIAKGIVEAHGGRIWVTSTPGEGSRFHVAIPAAPVEDHAASQ